MASSNLSINRQTLIISLVAFLTAELLLIKAEDAPIDDLEECLRDFDTEIVGLGGISLLGTMDSVGSYFKHNCQHK
jgi:hypothetical protein